MTPTTEFEMQIAQELGLSAEQIFASETTKRVWQRLVELEFSTRRQEASSETIILEAMESADEHADPEWKKRFDEALLWVARRKRELTSDDVLAHLEQLADQPKTHNLAAIGPAMIRAMKNDIIESSGRTQRSERPEKHGNRQNIWRSKLFNTGEQSCLF